METIRGECHCGATQFHVARAPEAAIRCDCGLCRKRGAVWACYGSDAFELMRPADDVGAYRCETASVHYFCRGCGCSTYSTDAEARHIWVNARLFDGIEIDRLPVRMVELRHG
ncbi:MAG: GFA family protein [Asticcacaulis sp.]